MSLKSHSNRRKGMLMLIPSPGPKINQNLQEPQAEEWTSCLERRILPCPEHGDLVSCPSMHVPFLNLAAQFAALKGELLPVIEKTLEGGHYVLGPNVTAFEQKIAAATGTRFGVG